MPIDGNLRRKRRDKNGWGVKLDPGYWFKDRKMAQVTKLTAVIEIAAVKTRRRRYGGDDEDRENRRQRRQPDQQPGKRRRRSMALLDHFISAALGTAFPPELTLWISREPQTVKAGEWAIARRTRFSRLLSTAIEPHKSTARDLSPPAPNKTVGNACSEVDRPAGHFFGVHERL